MRPHPQDIQDALNRWLAAEQLDSSEEADGALRELFEALPLLAPAAGFADRVFARAGLRPAKRNVVLPLAASVRSDISSVRSLSCFFSRFEMS